MDRKFLLAVGLCLFGMGCCFGLLESHQALANAFEAKQDVAVSAADEGVTELVNRQRREIRELHERIKSDPKKVAHLRAHLEFYVDELESKKAKPAFDEQALWPFRRRCRGRCCGMADLNSALILQITRTQSTCS